MSSCAISAGLNFRPTGVGMVAELLAIETLLRPHSEAPVPSGMFLRYARYNSHQDVGLLEHCVHESEGAVFPV